jgi:hypothetical protein
VRPALAVALAAVAATTASLFLATSSSSALACPKGTVPYTIYVAGQVPVNACKPAPYPPCDPGPCDPTAIAPQQ